MDVAYKSLTRYQGVAKRGTCAELERRYFNSLGLETPVNTRAKLHYTFD